MYKKLLPTLIVSVAACGGPETDFSESAAAPTRAAAEPVLCNEFFDANELTIAPNPPLTEVRISKDGQLLAIYQAFSFLTEHGDARRIGPNGFYFSNLPSFASHAIIRLYKTYRPGPTRAHLPVQDNARLELKIYDDNDNVISHFDDLVTSCSSETTVHSPSSTGYRAQVLVETDDGLSITLQTS